MTKVKDLFQKGQENLRAQAVEEEKKKVGVLRGGSSGIMLGNTAAGNCLVRTWLRYTGQDPGMDEEEAASSGLLFEAGHFNEDAWIKVLRAGGWDGVIKQEEEIPVSFTTEDGHLITGRPDIVLCDNEGKPQLGIELKLVASIWTARSVLLNKTPKLGHLIQAAFYSHCLQTPWELWYTNRVYFETSADFAQKDYPAYGAPGSEYFQYVFTNLVGGKKQNITEEQYVAAMKSRLPNLAVEARARKYKPFVQGFYLFWDAEGFLNYQALAEGETTFPAVKTVITVNRILEFYNKVPQVPSLERLEVPTTIKADGKKESWSLCSYCPHQDTCPVKNKTKEPLDKWAKRINSK